MIEIYFERSLLNSKKLRLNLNVPLKIEEKVEQKVTEKQIDDERVMNIQAAIVRVMKARKELDHQNLVIEVIAQLSSRFKPQPDTIKVLSLYFPPSIFVGLSLIYLFIRYCIKNYLFPFISLFEIFEFGPFQEKYFRFFCDLNECFGFNYCNCMVQLKQLIQNYNFFFEQKQIEILIDKEYLERKEGEKNVYVYVS